MFWRRHWGSVTGPSKRGGATALPNFWGSPLTQTTLFKEERPIRPGNTCMWGLARYYAVSRALHLMAIGHRGLTDPNFAVSPLLMRTRLDLQQLNPAG